MDEFDKDLTVNLLIINNDIKIKSIHVLPEPKGFTIGIHWFDSDRLHFKIFKNEDRKILESLKYFISTDYPEWHNHFENWSKKNNTPLYLKSN